jgi:uncharacterized protein DUF1553/uncharacterized protein DUF1549/cytochrome c
MIRPLLCAIAGSVVFAVAAAAQPDRVSFNRDIRPIMSDTCFRCHGPDRNARKAEMRLDIKDDAIKPTRSGRIPIVPGEPDKSEIIARIFSAGANRMPPSYAHKELSDAQKETIRRWVAEGAVYEAHWTYQPVTRPPVPEVADVSRVRNPIDSFIQERLRRQRLTPAKEADKRTLLRRVTLDLTGLLPTPDEMRAFLSDASPDAYETVVERLLSSPHYAEQRTMRWLDAVRYGDTAGFHGDNPIPAWPYRDYVLHSFRDNAPFDQFTREQIAGDLLPKATVEQKVASAYNRLNRTSAEGGLQPKEYLAKYAADRVRTLSAVWLGSTLGCAECHDHKFDPFLAKDFYAMKAFFADIQETGLVPDRGARAWGAKLALPTEAQKRELTELDTKITAAKMKLDDAIVRAKLDGAVLDSKAVEEDPREIALKTRWEAGELAWTWLHPIAAHALKGATLTIYNHESIDSNFYLDGSLKTEARPGDGLVVASGANPDRETYVVTVKPGAGTWRQIGVEVVHDDSLPGARYARGADRFLLSEMEAELVDGTERRRLQFRMATVNDTPPAVSAINDPTMPPLAAIDGNLKTAWGISFGEARNPFLALQLAEPLETTAASTIVVTLRHESDLRRAVVGRFRLALAADTFAWPPTGEYGRRVRSHDATGRMTWASGLPEDVQRALRRPVDDRDEAERTALREYLISSAPETAELYRELQLLTTERGLLDASIPYVITTVATEPTPTRILPRGNWMDDSAPVVEPAIPRFLGALDTKGERATRLNLANWLVSRDNPLTARTFVNRTWREFFGTGLSRVLDDLGSQGDWPTHPELLDWLASEFMERWDVKHIIRLIVTSYAYRQSSIGEPEAVETDPENRLLAHQNRFRIDAENVRDVALQVSGLLADKFGGPSVRPVQPAGYLAALNFPRREYSASIGEDLYRRGLYTSWQRTFLHPSMLNFDAPTREECTVSRTVSNTPLQALDLLNDPIYVEAARVFAQEAMAKGGRRFDDQLAWVFDRALNRFPSSEERRILRGLYERNLQRFAGDPGSAREFLAEGEAPLPPKADAVRLAAMGTVTRAVLNLHEVITRN